MSTDTADVLFAVVPVVLLVALLYLTTVRSRARSRRRHVDVAITGTGSWEGVVDEEDVERFLPDVRIGLLKSLWITEGVRVRLDLDPGGLRLSIVSRLLKGDADEVWAAPWGEVVAAESRPVGFRSLGGKISPVRLTDVLITTVGESARPFLDSWDLLPDPDEGPATDEDLAEEAEWLASVRDMTGEDWQPGTSLLRIRMSAADGLVEAITRWGHGSRLPAPYAG